MELRRTATKRIQETLLLFVAIALLIAASAVASQDYGDCTPGYWNPPPFADGSRLYDVPRWCVSVVRDTIPGLIPIGSQVTFHAGVPGAPIEAGPERTVPGIVTAYQFSWGPEGQEELVYFVRIEDAWYYSLFPSLALKEFQLTNP